VQLPPDPPLALLSAFFCGANQSYFMGLFFFIRWAGEKFTGPAGSSHPGGRARCRPPNWRRTRVGTPADKTPPAHASSPLPPSHPSPPPRSGYFTPPSLARKGPLRFVADRVLRLVVPCAVYSLLFPPIMFYINTSAKSGGPSLAEIFAGYLSPAAEPTKYNIGNGPMWFVWMLFWFQAAYAVVAAGWGVLAARRARRDCIGPGDDGPPPPPPRPPVLGTRPAGCAAPPPYSLRALLGGAAGLVVALTVLCGAARLASAPYRGFNAFITRAGVINFMPDFFAQ
jgi:hypothetical protein